MEKKRGYRLLTETEIQNIIDLFKSGKYEYQSDIAKKVGRDGGTVSIVLKNYQKYGIASASKKPAGVSGTSAKPIEKAKKQKKAKPVSKTDDKVTEGGGKKYKPYERLAPTKSEISVLKKAKSIDDFIINYFKRFGFGRRTTYNLRYIWTKRSRIFAQQQEQKKQEENIAAPKKPAISGENIAAAKAIDTVLMSAHAGKTNGDPDLETLVAHTNNRLALQYQILKEIKKVLEDQLTFFKEEKTRIMNERAARSGSGGGETRTGRIESQ